MLRVELIKQLLRVRSLVALAALAAVPLVAGLSTASHAGSRDGNQGGLYGAATFSALNHVAASLQFVGPLPLALVVALLGSAFGAADRDWGTLRYLYVQPVSRARLVRGKWSALALCCVLAVACVIVAALLTGLVIFGWHPFHRLGATNLSAGAAIGKLAMAIGYVTVCALCIGTVAFALGLILPGSTEAFGVSIAAVVGSSIVDGQPALHRLTVVLPVHYWQRWTALFDGEGGHGMALGLAVQVGAIVASVSAAWAVLARRDPAA
jgi:ABC-type transport system involved in multi-copper enzyme maturation permease subunit